MKYWRRVIRSGGARWRGGRGNARLPHPHHQFPRVGARRRAKTARSSGTEAHSDVGLVGEPKAGKSTLLQSSPRRTPRSPTTRSHVGAKPGRGRHLRHRSYVVADIPGSLKEPMRARAGLPLPAARRAHPDSSVPHPLDSEDPQATYDGLRSEVRQYSSAMADKGTWVIMTNGISCRRPSVARVARPEALGVRAI